MYPLRQSTAAVVQFGTFVDATDGKTFETGLVSAIDHVTTGIRISKAGATSVMRNGGSAVTASVYDAFGNYRVALTTGDTGTLGSLKMMYGDPATCLYVEREFRVLTANVFDALFRDATGTTDYLDTETAAMAADVLTGAALATSAVTEIQGGLDGQVRNAILNWAPITGVTLAKILRALARFFTTTTTGRNIATPAVTEVYVDTLGSNNISVTYDANGNRTAVDISAVSNVVP